MPALFERVGRLEAATTLIGAMSRDAVELHHVPELLELGDRRPDRLGTEKSARLKAGAALDLSEAAEYARRSRSRSRAGSWLGRRTARVLADSPDRELEVLRLVADGATTREISDQLFISAKTADHHIQHIYTKIGVSSRATVARWALEHGVVETANAG